MDKRILRLGFGALLLAVAVAACSAGSGSGSSTLVTASVGSAGTVIVAGSNGMTLYEFDQDVANSGTSACTATDELHHHVAGPHRPGWFDAVGW